MRGNLLSDSIQSRVQENNVTAKLTNGLNVDHSNYVVLNGKSSKLVNGLIIQSLPPVSKPMMRTQIEEIDGRDGDIVTNLGYSAYDKQMLIGLYGNFDIDAVIEFFNSKGTVTFSNEPDKQYYYEVTASIDFERLIRFRKATVTFHVQPYKYSIADNGLSIVPAENEDVIYVYNYGNTTSRPIITVYGTGTINLSVNHRQIFVLDIGNDGYITVDIEHLEAYKADVLKNRYVTGDFENLVFEKGKNTISWSGSVTEFQFEKVSRWV